MEYSFQSVVEVFEHNVWGHHFMVPQEVFEALSQDGQKRVRCTVNSKVEFPCALMPLRGEAFILLNQSIRSQLGIREGHTVHATVVKDHSEYGMPMPEEFSVTLELDAEAAKYFEALTMGKKRSLIYIVLKVKNVNSRISKSLAIAHHLRTQEGNIDYKQLMEDFKVFANNARNRA